MPDLPHLILIVDDDPMNRLALSRGLELEGYTVALAEDGLQAMDMLQTRPFDLVLLDIVMPRMDGYQVLNAMKRSDSLRDVPVIVISAVDEVESVVRCIESGAEDYLARPFNPVLLRARIGASLEKKRLRDRERAYTRQLQIEQERLVALNRMGQKLTAILDLQEVIERLLQAVTEIIGAEGAAVWLWDGAQSDQLVCRAAIYRGQPSLPTNPRLLRGQGIAGQVAETGRTLMLARQPGDERIFFDVDAQNGFHTTSLLATPLRARQTVIGALEVINKADGDFTPDDQSLVETLAAFAAIAADNARLVEALRQHAVELEARNQDLDAFAHTVAHDLKNPISAVFGVASILKTGLHKLPGDEVEGYLHMISQTGRRMTNIVNELLLLASVRKEEVAQKPLDMGGIVTGALNSLSYLIEEYQAEIRTPETWPAALGHAPWVEQVWVNYISNAIKYGGDPPVVELGFDESASQQIGEEASTHPFADSPVRFIRFWVRDNGAGLTPEEQGRLFTPFTRLDQVRARGHGLGLSIVRRIVEKLNGQVGVTSQAGQGSVFSFTLPSVV